MSICYDLRFAELALWYRMNGAHILTYPAAFTVNTGLAHWEVCEFYLRHRRYVLVCDCTSSDILCRSPQKDSYDCRKILKLSVSYGCV